MFSKEKRWFGDDSGDSLDDSPWAELMKKAIPVWQVISGLRYANGQLRPGGLIAGGDGIAVQKAMPVVAFFLEHELEKCGSLKKGTRGIS
jgi:hypothetical protein